MEIPVSQLRRSGSGEQEGWSGEGRGRARGGAGRGAEPGEGSAGVRAGGQEGERPRAASQTPEAESGAQGDGQGGAKWQAGRWAGPLEPLRESDGAAAGGKGGARTRLQGAWGHRKGCRARHAGEQGLGGLGATSGPWATAEGWPCSTRRCPHEPLAPSAPPPCADGRGCRGQLPLTARSPLRPPRPHVHPLPSPLSQFLRQKRPQAYPAFVRHCPQLSILKISNLWKRLKKHLAPFARLASPVVRIWQPAGRLWSTLSLSLCRSPQGSSEPPEGKLKTP